MCMMPQLVQRREADGKFQVIELGDVWVSVMEPESVLAKGCSGFVAESK